MANASVKVAYIGGAALIITTIITGLFTCNTSATPSKGQVFIEKNGSENNSGINNADRDNNFAGRDFNQTNIYGDTSRSKKNNKPKKESVIFKDERVISYNQQGGITAHTVIVPEDKEVSLADNREVDIRNEGSKIVFSVKPQQGQWDSVFIAYPSKEDSIVNAKFSNTLNKVLVGFASGTVDYNFNDGNGNVTFKLFICSGQPATKKMGYKIACDKLPSKIVFGDYGKQDKTFAVVPYEK
jgi:hypothetical protein